MQDAEHERFHSGTTLDADALAHARLGCAFALLFVVYAALLVTHAWMVDDAYITLRTVDNFVHGLGLTWNPDERVQVYTHPLWMFACCALYAITHEAFYTVLALSFVTSLLALAVAARGLDRHASPWGKLVVLGTLLSSKAFLDFSSSGLENPLTHLLLVVFFLRFLFPARPWEQASLRQVALLFLVAALGFVNREDTLLFFAPACAYVLVLQWRSGGLRAFLPAALGGAPVPAWLLFSLFYYGSAVPNTAYAKLIGPRLTGLEQLGAGIAYFLDSLLIDFSTLPLCVLAVVVGLRRRNTSVLCVLAGLLLYLGYVLCDGAVGTHMSGRFFSGPALVAALLLGTLCRERADAYPLLAFSTLVLLASPFSPLRVGTSLYGNPLVARGKENVIDTRDYVLHEGAALLDFRPGIALPNHAAYQAGERFRADPRRVNEGGPGPGFALMVGYSGYTSGPKKHIVDILGLCDPLIARLPLAKRGSWRPGHFFRALPAGYMASVEQNKNLIADPDLAQYYNVLLQITRGPLFSRDRLLAIWRLNTGHYEHYLRAYAGRHDLR